MTLTIPEPPNANVFGSLIFRAGHHVPKLDAAVAKNVSDALAEDLCGEDLSAAIAGHHHTAKATVVTLDDGILSGMFWVETVFHTLDPKAKIQWFVKDGEAFRSGTNLCAVQGTAKALLAGERCALNFLQTLTAAATTTAKYVKQVAKTKARIADTRKTLPGLRIAQKYAVVCGGGVNQRHGLYDGILIKDNHIQVAGTLSQAVAIMRKAHPGRSMETETESLDQVEEALSCGVEIIMLDNFSLSNIKEAVAVIAEQAVVEVSGNIHLENAAEIAACNVDYLSIGALTKHVCAPDLSMRLLQENRTE